MLQELVADSFSASKCFWLKTGIVLGLTKNIIPSWQEVCPALPAVCPTSNAIDR
jgi:hypothetical protein